MLQVWLKMAYLRKDIGIDCTNTAGNDSHTRVKIQWLLARHQGKRTEQKS